jgi:divalent metal cation (Fe/Co/Zn/Cd) transporter
MKDVRDCSKPSVRLTGKRVRVEVSVSLDSNLEFERTHRIGLGIEREVKKLLPNARVIIEPPRQPS